MFGPSAGMLSSTNLVMIDDGLLVFTSGLTDCCDGTPLALLGELLLYVMMTFRGTYPNRRASSGRNSALLFV